MGGSFLKRAGEAYFRLAREREEGVEHDGADRLTLEALEGLRRVLDVLPIFEQVGQAGTLPEAFHAAVVGRGLRAEAGSTFDQQLRAQTEALRSGVGMPHSWTHEVPRRYPYREAYPLPAPAEPNTVAFADVVRRRRSCRDFADAPIPHETLGEFLALGAGVTAEGRRVAPSGGSLYPLDVYVVGRVAVSPDRVQEGVFLYDHEAHRLLDVTNEVAAGRSLPRDLWNPYVADALYGSLDAMAGATFVFLVGNLDVSRGKYGNFGYILGLLEAGHLGQALCLSATAAGLGAVPLGFANVSCRDLPEVLGIDAMRRTLLHTIAVGVRA